MSVLGGAKLRKTVGPSRHAPCGGKARAVPARRLSPTFGGQEMSGRMEPNAAVEIHDSSLERIETRGRDVVATIRAYVHRSAGRPGIDAGTGWIQPVRLEFPKATATGSIDAIPMELLGGRLVLSGGTFDNLIPMPVMHVGTSRLELESWNDARIVIEGDGVSGAFAGPPEYVEDIDP